MTRVRTALSCGRARSMARRRAGGRQRHHRLRGHSRNEQTRGTDGFHNQWAFDGRTGQDSGNTAVESVLNVKQPLAQIYADPAAHASVPIGVQRVNRRQPEMNMLKRVALVNGSGKREAWAYRPRWRRYCRSDTIACTHGSRGNGHRRRWLLGGRGGHLVAAHRRRWSAGQSTATSPPKRTAMAWKTIARSTLARRGEGRRGGPRGRKAEAFIDASKMWLAGRGPSTRLHAKRDYEATSTG